MKEQIIKHKANKIVDTNYNKNKHKTPFTQVADNAVKYLGFTYDAASRTYTNDDGQTVSENEAREINKGLNKNFQEQKQDDYLALLKHNGIEESKVKHPDYPRAAPKTKLANMPLINRNINNLKTTPTKTNPTIERYKQFKEEKKFNENFEKEYSDKATENFVRSKVNKNIREGKKPYENLSTNYIIVNEAAKDRAKKQLDAIKTTKKFIVEPDYLSQTETIQNSKPGIKMPSLDEWMRTRAPIEQEPAGITGLNKVKGFKRSAYLADQKFPKVAKGIGPFISGEDDK